LKNIILFLIAFTGHYAVLQASEITGKVVSVIDGNTIEVESTENGIQKIVLDGIDSPELEQAFGIEAKVFLEKLVMKKTVRVEFTRKDRFGNYLAVIWLGDDDLRVELLKSGLAWTQEKNPATDLEGYRQWAQQKGKGLWKSESPTPPWTFRRQQSMLQPKTS
jgi:micrococcal nuclease